MPRHRLAVPLAAALALAPVAEAASLTPPNLVTASTLADPDLLLVWPYAAGGPLEAISWSTFKAQMTAGLSGQFLTPANNLGDLNSPATARTNLGLGSVATGAAGASGNVFCALISNCTHSGEELLAASTSARAGLNLAPGAAPSAPVDGDVWTTSAGVFAQINGATQQFGNVRSGTYAPTPQFATVGTSTWSYSVRSGNWACENGWLTADGKVVAIPTTIGTATGNFEITLPNGYAFSDPTHVSGSIGFMTGFNFGGTFSIGADTSSTIYVIGFTASGSGTNALNTTEMTAGQGINIAFTYRAKISGSC